MPIVDGSVTDTVQYTLMTVKRSHYKHSIIIETLTEVKGRNVTTVGKMSQLWCKETPIFP